ncbi:MAG: GNAT family N-acetyltransferase [Cyanobacteriota bacterium]|nr:GNAT family N-acetyltransferase [Cyanobacteriota bacterium]
MDLEIVPCLIEQIEKLIEGGKAFHAAYGFGVADGYLPFEGALQYSLTMMQSSQVWHPWLPYWIGFHPERMLVGICGFKSVPDAQRTVEIGYSIAPSYQGKGFATAAARQLIAIAFSSTDALVDCVCAHTLAERNASTRVLEKCGMRQVAEIIDPEDGKVWRWEVAKA